VWQKNKQISLFLHHKGNTTTTKKTFLEAGKNLFLKMDALPASNFHS